MTKITSFLQNLIATVNVAIAIKFDAPLSLQEIILPIKAMHNKAPGLDEFPVEYNKFMNTFMNKLLFM